MVLRYQCLRQKEVINICEGRSLGYLCDLIFDECKGHIHAIVVPGSCGLRGLFQKKDYGIPWKDICKIGDDVILVQVDLESCEIIR